MDTELDSIVIAIVALVIAVVAMFVASAQLLQQVFGTAEGYRRCQYTVMGAWSKETTRRWIWSEFRFETLYQTPHFTIFRDPGIHDRAVEGSKGGSVAHAVNNSDVSRSLTLSPKENGAADGSEVVSWAALIHQLHELQGRYLMPRAAMRNYIRETDDFYDVSGLGTLFEQDKSEMVSMTSPAIERRSRSWDLLPPDIHRPLATTTLGTAVCLAHRLGMSWITLRPSEGIMRAEGNGQSLAAQPIRGLGIVLQYNIEKNVHVRDPVEVVAAMRIPTGDADKMGCGIIPGDKKSFPGLWDIPLVHDRSGRSVDGKLLSSAMEKLEVLPEAIQYVCDEMRESAGRTATARAPGFSDLPGLWCGFMPLRSSHINSIVHPMGARLDSPFETREGRTTWRRVLNARFAAEPSGLSGQQVWVMRQLNLLFNGFRGDFIRNRALPRGNRLEDTKLLLKLRDIFDATTAWFQLLDAPAAHKPPAVAVSIFDDGRARLREARKVDRFYADMVAAHVSVAAFAHVQAQERVRARQVRDDASVLPDTFDPLLVEQAYIYCDNIEAVVQGMRKRGQIARLGYINPFYTDDGLVRDAWWTIMLRAVVWFMGTHRLEADEVSPVASHYYDSTTTVYIT